MLTFPALCDSDTSGLRMVPGMNRTRKDAMTSQEWNDLLTVVRVLRRF